MKRCFAALFVFILFPWAASAQEGIRALPRHITADELFRPYDEVGEAVVAAVYLETGYERVIDARSLRSLTQTDVQRWVDALEYERSTERPAYGGHASVSRWASWESMTSRVLPFGFVVNDRGGSFTTLIVRHHGWRDLAVTVGTEFDNEVVGGFEYSKRFASLPIIERPFE